MKSGKYKRFKFVIAALVGVLILLPFVMTGCTQERVESIQILDGFAEQYTLDAKLNTAGASILVKTTKGSRTEPITEEMVRGFDTSKVGEYTLTVSYGGQTAVFHYRVTYTLPVNSSARVSASLSGQSLTVRIGRLDLPLYGIAFSIAVGQEGMPTVEPHSNFSLVSKPFRVAANKIRIAMVGRFPVEKDGVIATIRGNISAVTVSDVVLSDGQRDYILPDYKGD